MGRDKALLPWGGATLLGHALERLRAVCADVAILSGAEPRYVDAGAPVLTRRRPDGGPLAGLVAALDHARHDRVLLLAVDVPFAPAELLRHLLETRRRPTPWCPWPTGARSPSARRTVGAAPRRPAAVSKRESAR